MKKRKVFYALGAIVSIAAIITANFLDLPPYVNIIPFAAELYFIHAWVSDL